MGTIQVPNTHSDTNTGLDTSTNNNLGMILEPNIDTETNNDTNTGLIPIQAQFRLPVAIPVLIPIWAQYP